MNGEQSKEEWGVLKDLAKERLEHHRFLIEICALALLGGIFALYIGGRTRTLLSTTGDFLKNFCICCDYFIGFMVFIFFAFVALLVIVTLIISVPKYSHERKKFKYYSYKLHRRTIIEHAQSKNNSMKMKPT